MRRILTHYHQLKERLDEGGDDDEDYEDDVIFDSDSGASEGEEH